MKTPGTPFEVKPAVAARRRTSATVIGTCPTPERASTFAPRGDSSPPGKTVCPPTQAHPVSPPRSQLCEEHLAGRYHIEVIDLMKNPQLAQGDQILAVPTSPIRKFIGNLSNPERSSLRFGNVLADKMLYVAGSTPQSSRAITNIKTICETHLKDRYALTVVDLYEHRERAREDQIMVAPTLIRQSPLPVRRLIGDLSQTERVLAALDLAPIPDHA